MDEARMCDDRPARTVPVFLPAVWQASSLPIVRPVWETARARDHALHAPGLRALFSAKDSALSGD
jgi:hypothetical protein